MFTVNKNLKISADEQGFGVVIVLSLFMVPIIFYGFLRLSVEPTLVKTARAKLDVEVQMLCKRVIQQAPHHRSMIQEFSQSVTTLSGGRSNLGLIPNTEIIGAQLIVPTAGKNADELEVPVDGPPQPISSQGIFSGLSPCVLKNGNTCEFGGDIPQGEENWSNFRYPKEIWDTKQQDGTEKHFNNEGSVAGCELTGQVNLFGRTQNIRSKAVWRKQLAKGARRITLAVAPHLTTRFEQRFLFPNGFFQTNGLDPLENFHASSPDNFPQSGTRAYGDNNPIVPGHESLPNTPAPGTDYPWGYLASSPALRSDIDYRLRDQASMAPVDCEAPGETRCLCDLDPRSCADGSDCSCVSPRAEALIAAANPVSLVRNIFFSSIAQTGAMSGYLRDDMEILLVGSQDRQKITGQNFDSPRNVPTQFNTPTVISEFNSLQNQANATIPFVSYNAGIDCEYLGLSQCWELAPEFGSAGNGVIGENLVARNQTELLDPWRQYSARIAQQLRFSFSLYSAPSGNLPTGIRVYDNPLLNNLGFHYGDSLGASNYEFSSEAEQNSHYNPYFRPAYTGTNGYWNGIWSQRNWSEGGGDHAHHANNRMRASEVLATLGNIQSCPYPMQIGELTNPHPLSGSPRSPRYCEKPPKVEDWPDTPSTHYWRYSEADIRADLVGTMQYMIDRNSNPAHKHLGIPHGENMENVYSQVPAEGGTVLVIGFHRPLLYREVEPLRNLSIAFLAQHP